MDQFINTIYMNKHNNKDSKYNIILRIKYNDNNRNPFRRRGKVAANRSNLNDICFRANEWRVILTVFIKMYIVARNIYHLNSWWDGGILGLCRGLVLWRLCKYERWTGLCFASWSRASGIENHFRFRPIARESSHSGSSSVTRITHTCVLCLCSTFYDWKSECIAFTYASFINIILKRCLK